MASETSRRTLLSRKVRLVLLFVLFLGVWRLAHSGLGLLLDKDNDFPRYWAAGRLLLSGGNPYSPAEMLNIQTPLHVNGPRMMFNPPWVLTVVAPFALLPFDAAAVAWFLLQFALVFLSALWLWQLYAGPAHWRWMAIVIPGTFLPVAAALHICQMTPLVLLGVVAFLHFVSTGKYKLAGCALPLLALKPQLVLPLGCVILLWCVRERRWPLLACAAAGFAVLLAPVWFRPELLAQHQQLFGTIWEDILPGWGGLLRRLFGPEKMWLQYLPAIPGIVWAILHWGRQRRHWDWKQQLPLLLLVSFISAPYAWTFDQVLFLPALISSAILVLGSPDRQLRRWVFAIYLGLNLVMLLLNRAGANDRWYLWSAPVWLLFYLALNSRMVAGASAEPSKSGYGVSSAIRFG